jgi:hypothetical protein
VMSDTAQRALRHLGKMNPCSDRDASRSGSMFWRQ